MVSSEPQLLKFNRHRHYGRREPFRGQSKDVLRAFGILPLIDAASLSSLQSGNSRGGLLFTWTSAILLVRLLRAGYKREDPR